MKKRICFFFSVCIFSTSLLVEGQLRISPAKWSTFVNSSENILVTDTFKYQDFDKQGRNNWNYIVSGGAAVFDASVAGIKGQHGNFSLKIPLGGEVQFDEIDIRKYQNTTISASYAGSKLVKQENLNLSLMNEDSGNIEVELAVPASSSPSSFNFGEKFPKGNPIRLQGNPHQVSFRAASAADGSVGGFYCIDLITAYGDIQSYSLFTGTGEWNNASRWSHLPAARNRNALIQGKVTVSTVESCDTLCIENGNVLVKSGAELSIGGNLCLYQSPGKEVSFVNLGSITPPRKVTFTKEFDKKGSWYFISFPFDVYMSDITPFTLKNGEPNEGGNYFYVKYYNARQRAISGLERDNWVTISSVSSSKPLFEKNKGYLIALDEAATTSSITFSSKPGDIPSTFGNNGDIDIPFYAYQEKIYSPHSGWTLCGNPFPAPLSLRSLAGITGIGQYVYWYDGNTYQVYTIGSNEKIPPFGAFFIKATHNCTASVKQTENIITRSETTISPYDFSICVHDGERSDKASFRLTDKAIGNEEARACKLHSLDPTMPQIASYTSLDKTPLAVNTVSEEKNSIPLSLYIGKSGSYSLSVSGVERQSGNNLFLIDHTTSDTILLSKQQVYKFNESAGTYNNRFSLLFQKDTKASDSLCSINGNVISIKDLPRKGYIKIVNSKGYICQRISLPKGSSTSFLSVKGGLYTVYLKAGEYNEQIEAVIN